MKRFILAVGLCGVVSTLCLAEQNQKIQTTWQYASNNQNIFAVAVSPDVPEGISPYFTAESLKELLPDLWPAKILAAWCEGQWKQTGVVVLENKDIIFWHSCQKNLVVFEGRHLGSYGFKLGERTGIPQPDANMLPTE